MGFFSGSVRLQLNPKHVIRIAVDEPCGPADFSARIFRLILQMRPVCRFVFLRAGEIWMPEETLLAKNRRLTTPPCLPNFARSDSHGRFCSWL